MTAKLSFEVISWIAADGESPELAATSGWLRVILGEQLATRADDDRSRSVRDVIFVSAYPLAIWMATSWWRLLWEPMPDSEPSLDWWMSHEMGAAGHGFLWPSIRFASDGEWVSASCRPSTSTSRQPLRFLTQGHARLPIHEFERALVDFVTLVVERLRVVGADGSTLRELWAEVCAERTDPAASAWRRLEARLGFDAGEVPEAVIREFQRVGTTVGFTAIDEIAPVCAGHDAARELSEIIQFAESGGEQGHFAEMPEFRDACKRSSGMPPWERGWSLARSLRVQVAAAEGVITDQTLGELLGLPTHIISNDSPTVRRPLGLAVRSGASGGARLLFRKRHPRGRRFEAGRFLVDHFLNPAVEEHWLPETDAKTVRQKTQRAFAAELLVPIASLQDKLDGDYSEDSIEDAAEYFNVSPFLVRSHLANNGAIPSGGISSEDQSQGPGWSNPERR